jgi:hypothetical protein
MSNRQLSSFRTASHKVHFLWVVIAIVFTLAAFIIPTEDTPLGVWIVVLGLPWTVALLRLTPSMGRPMRWLWRIPALLWLIWLVALVALLVGWLLYYQPAAGINLRPIEWLYLLASAYGLLFLFTTAVNARNASSTGSTGEPKPVPKQQRSLGILAGPLITLTTVLLILIGLELGMRFVWIASDSFQFSKMHQNWARLYWNPLNELDYRDYAIPAADDFRQHVIVAGDSLAAGYGVNDIADTFPHLLGDLLGEGYTVNIVAQPGWGITTALAQLENYPLAPDILILSHYTNDIVEGPAGKQYNRPFPKIRLDPEPGLQAWLVNNSYLANFLYYRVFLYFRHESMTLYNDWIRNSYDDPAVWSAYEDEMQAVIDWAQAHQVQLVVLVWPNLLDVTGSRNLTTPVVDYFSLHGVPVVDMSVYLAETPVSRLVANRFDSHPSVYSHHQAAEQLFNALLEAGIVPEGSPNITTG